MRDDEDGMRYRTVILSFSCERSESISEVGLATIELKLLESGASRRCRVIGSLFKIHDRASAVTQYFQV
jgi:hypothetical protein